MQIEKTNNELLSGWLGTFNSTMSVISRKNNVERVLAFIKDQSITTMQHGDFMRVFDVIKKNPEQLPILKLKKNGEPAVKSKLNWTIQSKQQIWRQFKSFVEYVQEATGIILNFPRKFAKWGNDNAPAPASTSCILTARQVNDLLEKAKYIDFKKYTMLVFQADTGMRCTQLVTIKTDWVHVDERWTETVPKGNGPNVIYPFSKRVQQALRAYMKARNAPGNIYLFPGNNNNHASQRIHEDFIKEIRETMPITSHTFRRTINSLRKAMDCSVEDRAFLLNQKVGNVNSDLYTKIENKIRLYDTWYPF